MGSRRDLYPMTTPNTLGTNALVLGEADDTKLLIRQPPRSVPPKSRGGGAFFSFSCICSTLITSRIRGRRPSIKKEKKGKAHRELTSTRMENASPAPLSLTTTEQGSQASDLNCCTHHQELRQPTYDIIAVMESCQPRRRELLVKMQSKGVARGAY